MVSGWAELVGHEWCELWMPPETCASATSLRFGGTGGLGELEHPYKARPLLLHLPPPS